MPRGLEEFSRKVSALLVRRATTMALPGASPVTTDAAATSALSPIVAPGRIAALDPIQTHCADGDSGGLRGLIQRRVSCDAASALLLENAQLYQERDAGDR